MLDAAHIIADRDKELGQPIVSNGLALSKLHHAAFDAQLIGVDPDYRLHVSDRLLAQHDVPMFEELNGLGGQELGKPRREQDLPNKERLAMRFEAFRKAAYSALFSSEGADILPRLFQARRASIFVVNTETRTTL